MGTMLLRRERQPWGDRIRKYRVLLDGQMVARLGWAQAINLPIEAGAHTLRVAVRRLGSPTVEFRIAENEELSFVCRLGHSPALALFSAFHARVVPDSWLVLEREHGQQPDDWRLPSPSP